MKDHLRKACLWVVVSLCLVASSDADTEQPKVRLGPRAKMVKVGPGMDARGLDLEGTEIVGQDLTGARFDRAKLRGARISDCDLHRASFNGADLRGATMSDCRVEGADFSDALINGIIGANWEPGRQALALSRTQLEATASFRQRDLSFCEIRGDGKPYDFRGVNLTGSLLSGDFSRSKFAGAKIHKAMLSGAFSSDEIRQTEDVRSGFLSGEFWFTVPMDLSNIFLKDSTVNIPARGAINLQNTTLYRCRVYFRGSSAAVVLPSTKSYKEGSLLQNTFLHSDMSDVNFDRMNLSGCRFDGCNLSGATFNDAVVSRVDFQTAKGMTADQIRSTWNSKRQRLSDVFLPADLIDFQSLTCPQNAEPTRSGSNGALR